MEKFDKSIVNHLKENFEIAERTITSYFSEVNFDLAKAESIDDVMKAKRRLLLSILYGIPMDGLYCYFCFATKCSECSYGKAHGACGSHQNKNTWWEIMKKLKEVRILVEEEYWTGEELKEEVAKDAKRR